MKLKINKKLTPILLVLILILILAFRLRFYNLGSNPPSPYWEEAAIGYDAYSILKTGKDFHGNSWPLIAFESFGDYKPSLYFYATVPSIAIFGLNTFAVRFPSLFFGSLTVLLIYLLAKQFFKTPIVALGSALLLAISPWHIQFSRAGFEANLGLFLVVLGAWLFLKGTKKKIWLFPAVLSWALSLYTYHANRIFIPLLGLTWGLYFFKTLIKKKSFSLISIFLFALLIFPLAIRLNTPEIKQRFLETSAFVTLEPIERSSQLITADGGGVIAGIVHHRAWQYSKIFLDHYFDHFNFNYLFVSGDSNPRHSTQLVGGLYLVQLPLLLASLYYLFKNKKYNLLPLLIWALLAPVPAALTKATPHALRSLGLVIPLAIISSYGAIELFKAKAIGKITIYLLSSILLFELSRYLYVYHHDYPRLHSFHWQTGYEEMIEFVATKKDDYDTIYITRELGRPSIYYWFYTKTNPKEVQALNNQVLKDQGEYLQFENIIFGQPDPQKPALVVVSESENSPGQLLKEIKNLNNQTIFKIYEQ